MTGTTWFRIRIALMVVGVIGTLVVSFFVPADQFDDSMSFTPSSLLFQGIFGLLYSALVPFMLLFVISIQSVNPLTNAIWARPTHQSNPLNLGNPLLFFHFAAYYVGVVSIAVMITSLWMGWIALIFGALTFLQAIMILVGVHLCMRVFQNKMTPE